APGCRRSETLRRSPSRHATPPAPPRTARRRPVPEREPDLPEGGSSCLRDAGSHRGFAGRRGASPRHPRAATRPRGRSGRPPRARSPPVRGRPALARSCPGRLSLEAHACEGDRSVRIGPLAVVKEPAGLAREEPQQGVDRRQPADAVPVLLPQGLSKEAFGVTLGDPHPERAVLYLNPRELGATYLPRVPEPGPHVREVRAGHDTVAARDGGHCVLYGLQHRLDRPRARGAFAAGQGLVREAREEGYDPPLSPAHALQVTKP